MTLTRWFCALIASLCVLTPSAALAQRFELVVVGGNSTPSGTEFERVTVVGPDTQRVRATARRTGGAAFGFQTSIPILSSQRFRLEGGLLVQPTERTSRETAPDDIDGPYVTNRTSNGTILTVWIAPTYRPVQTSRLHVALAAGPLLVNYGGLAYTQTEDGIGYPFPAVSAGILLAARGAAFFTRDFGVQLSAEFATFGFSAADRTLDFVHSNIETSVSNKRQSEFRIHAGLMYRYF